MLNAISFNAQRDRVAPVAPEMLQVPQIVFEKAAAAAAGAVGGVSVFSLDAAAPAFEPAPLSVEAAARGHLQALLEGQGSDRLAAITSPERPELVPDLKLERQREQVLMETDTVSFVQTARSIPVFGTRATVEVKGTERTLMSVEGALADVPDVDPLPALGPKQAAKALAERLGVDLSAVTEAGAPQLNFYADEQEGGSRWRLVYVFDRVAVTPAAADDAMQCCGSVSPFVPRRTCLVDADDGGLVISFNAAAHFDVPVACRGVDVDGVVRQFDGLPLPDGTVQLHDPWRNITTYDYQFADVSQAPPFPQVPVSNPTPEFGDASPAAVSAHYHATQVFDFFNGVLKHQGIDDKGMKLESVVNCYVSRENKEPSPIWRNAMWAENRMWYGQIPVEGGNRSTARYVDIIVHELTHGVTQHTAGLRLVNQSGALNESFSDIFAVMVRNWFLGTQTPVAEWDWSIGSGWKEPGTPLRSLADPGLGKPLWPKGPGQPAHMNEFVKTLQDDGGVHVNSGIHNRAAYNLITAKGADGSPVFTPEELARLYYLTLTRLAPLAKFSDCRRALLNIATTYYRADAAAQQAKLAAIAAAYDAVGIA
ncbi:MAG TPA: M4 family metallopeptidase [Longimicrobium sp.]|jgi:Zn-dependent metalloprotease